jgi:hypothetical protein
MIMDNIEKDTGTEPLPYCRLASVAEHARPENEDEPCNDYRAGMYKYPAVIDGDKLCSMIKDHYPSIGECGIDVKVDWDNSKKVWVIDFKRGGRIVTADMEPDDAALCMEGKECPSLKIKIDNMMADITKA